MTSAVEKAAEATAMATLTGLGWTWTDEGVVLCVATTAGVRRVLVPMRQVFVQFRGALGPQMGVGCPPHAVGFFGAIKRAARGIARKAKKAYKRVVPKVIRKAAGRVANVARQGLRIAHKALTSRAAQAIVAGLGVAVPVLAPAAAGMLAAQELMRRIDTGRRIAESVARGFTPRNRQAASRLMSVGNAAQRQVDGIIGNAKRGNQDAQRFLGAVASFAR